MSSANLLRNLPILSEALSINALHTRVYIYIRQLSSLRVPTLWFIDPTVATCHSRYNFLSLCQFLSGVNRQNMMATEGCLVCKALIQSLFKDIPQFSHLSAKAVL